MISDDELYKIAIFLGCAAMVLIVVYHFLDVNTIEGQPGNEQVTRKSAGGKQPVAMKRD